MPVNRIARHLDAPTLPPAPAIPPKEDLRGRYQFVSDAVLKAVAAVTRLLESDDPDVVMKAAKMILDLDKTRMRHRKEVHGAPRPEDVERAALLPPLPNYASKTQAEIESDFDDFEDDDEEEEDEFIPLPSSPPTEIVPENEVFTPEEDDDSNLTGEEEYQRWVTGYYARRTPAGPSDSTGPTPGPRPPAGIEARANLLDVAPC